MHKINMILLLSAMILLAACVPEKQAKVYPDVVAQFYAEHTIGYTADYLVRELRPSEKAEFVKKISELDGLTYILGGDDRKLGLDCSGIVIWAFQSLGYLDFRYGNSIVTDLTADNIFKYNVTYGVPVENPFQLVHHTAGDLLFFDNNRDGRMEHVAVFSHYDPQTEQVWVWDASESVGKTSHRIVIDFFKKNPYIGRPLLFESNQTLPHIVN